MCTDEESAAAHESGLKWLGNESKAQLQEQAQAVHLLTNANARVRAPTLLLLPDCAPDRFYLGHTSQTTCQKILRECPVHVT